MSWKTIKLKEVLKQYRIEHRVQNDIEYKQVTISKHTGVKFRGVKNGKNIGRKRQFYIDLNQYPQTLMLVRQGVFDGAIGLAPKEVNGCIATENMPMFSVVDINIEYLTNLLKSTFFKDELKKIPTTGSAQKSIHERMILEIEIPYPSLLEQKKIVNELQIDSSKIYGISTELTHQLLLVKQLRQSFLREAMQGHFNFAKQSDDNEETGAELLVRIKAKKVKLIKEGKLKKQKPLSSITKEEIPFEIPEDWVWCRLGAVAQMIFDGPFGSHLKTVDYTSDGVRVVRLENLGQMDFNLEKETYVSCEKYETIKSHEVFEGDVIIGSFLADGVRCTLLPVLKYKAIAKADCFTIRLNEKLVSNKYIMYLLNSSPMFTELFSMLRGMTRLRINTTQLKSLSIPLPPLFEQRRIVAKLDELMAYCDSLEESIKNSQIQKEILLQQVLREALEVKESLC